MMRNSSLLGHMKFIKKKGPPVVNVAKQLTSERPLFAV